MRTPRKFPLWSWERGRGCRLYVEFNAWPINRPYLIGGWVDERTCSGALAWGNRNSDPVWMVDLEVTLPERLGRLIDWYYERRR